MTYLNQTKSVTSSCSRQSKNRTVALLVTFCSNVASRWFRYSTHSPSSLYLVSFGSKVSCNILRFSRILKSLTQLHWISLAQGWPRQRWPRLCWYSPQCRLYIHQLSRECHVNELRWCGTAYFFPTDGSRRLVSRKCRFIVGTSYTRGFNALPAADIHDTVFHTTFAAGSSSESSTSTVMVRTHILNISSSWHFTKIIHGVTKRI